MTSTTNTGDAAERDFIQAHLEQFRIQWTNRLGSVGNDLSRDLCQLVDLLLEEHHRIAIEAVNETVEPWARLGSEERIPLSKITKEGLASLLMNPEYISNGELMKILKQRFDNP